MLLTIEALLKDPKKVQAFIDRAQVTMSQGDKVWWKEYLTPRRANYDGTFKTYDGVQTGVVAGSFIDPNAEKPIRSRGGMGYGLGEVAYLGEKYQMDNARMAELQVLIDTFNERGEAAVANEIVEFLKDDYRQCLLAPHKRLDIMLFELMFSALSGIETHTEKDGVKINAIDMRTVVAKDTVDADYENTLLGYLDSKISEYRGLGKDISILQLNRATFQKHIASSNDFGASFVSKFGSYEAKPGGLITEDMANAFLENAQIPFRFRIINADVLVQGGNIAKLVPDNIISAIPSGGLGNMRWVKPFELVDPRPGKNYIEVENGHYIASEHDKTGRFLEYGAAMIVDINRPNSMAIFDLSALNTD